MILLFIINYNNSSLQPPKQNPVWAYALLALATFMVSSAGAVLKLMSDVSISRRNI